MAKTRKPKPTKKLAKKAPAKKAPAKKAPAKARLMSSAEIRLKNTQAQLNKEIRKAEKEIAKLRDKTGGNLDKRIKEKGRARSRKAKTILNEEANKLTKLVTKLKETTLERQIISKGAYKPKTSNANKLKGREATKPKKGIRTINSFLAWKRNECLEDVLQPSKIYGVKVVSVDGISREEDAPAIIDLIDSIFNNMQSEDLCTAKINLATGDIMLEVKLGGNKKEEDEES